eukprot:CAMPEP_0119003784 /NCGR_PEP_ID=MMETSP1176-20130426/762_1 /TAXON_ID=265551 /ORGANISM="Synedropsis recta cf, Strain CCMP1620" /LENGTH=169 /DNA_ID=CAMNT_0006955411 /DNA_START=115 /DNA_END=624 /DNA_ORIENTATION=+
MSHYTTSLANSLCGGSSRKLIAGWWYSILTVTAILTLCSFVVMSTRSLAEGFAATWSAILLLVLSIGGTMIMRKFHNSMAVGFFMGGVVAMSQLFFMLFLVYCGYGRDQKLLKMSAKEESLMAFFCLIQCILLGSFAAILGAHRSEILDKSSSSRPESPYAYEPPVAAA